MEVPMLARPEWNMSAIERKRAGPKLYAFAAIAAFTLLVLGDIYVMWTVLRLL
jgi:hypothetical protein